MKRILTLTILSTMLSIAIQVGRLPADDGQPPLVSASFRNTPVREAFTVLARQGRLNLVVGPGVEGRVSAYFRRVDPLQAIRVLADQVGAEVEPKGDSYIIRLRPAEPPSETASSVLESQAGNHNQPDVSGSQAEEPARLTVFHPRYQRASTLARMLGGYTLGETDSQPSQRGQGVVGGTAPYPGYRGGFYSYPPGDAPWLHFRTGSPGHQMGFSFSPGQLWSRLGGLSLGYDLDPGYWFNRR